MPARDPILRERIARHALTDRRCESATAAAALTTAVQAQDTPASRLGLRARSTSITEADVVRAVEAERTIVRTWLMRGTIHLVAATDLGWMVRLFGPAIVRRYDKRWNDLGLTSVLRDATLDALPEILADGPLTRHEITDALAQRGLTLLDPEGYGPTHIIVHASTTGLICRGPDRGRDSTFGLTSDWLPDAPPGPSGDDAIAELARRYFAAYSPATTADFGTWSGLAPVAAVGLIRDELTPVEVYGRPGWRLGEHDAGATPDRTVRLMPAFDNYLLGYKDRASLVAAERYGAIYQGGMIHPTVTVDGRVVGRWHLNRAKGVVTLRPFEAWPKTVQRAVEGEVADVARFTERDLTPVVEPVS